MTELIKEQLFQHQMTQSKEEEIAAMETPSGQWLSEGSISGPHSLYGDESIQESLSDVRLFFRERDRDRDRDRETDRQTDGQTDRQTDRETDRQTEREREGGGESGMYCISCRQ